MQISAQHQQGLEWVVSVHVPAADYLTRDEIIVVLPNPPEDRTDAVDPLHLWGGRWDSNPRQPESQSGTLTS